MKETFGLYSDIGPQMDYINLVESFGIKTALTLRFMFALASGVAALAGCLFAEWRSIPFPLQYYSTGPRVCLYEPKHDSAAFRAHNWEVITWE
jgi:hypothetical protein